MAEERKQSRKRSSTQPSQGPGRVCRLQRDDPTDRQSVRQLRARARGASACAAANQPVTEESGVEGLNALIIFTNTQK